MIYRRLVLTLVAVLLGAGYAHATPVQLQLVNVGPGYNDGHFYVYPYNFSVNGSQSLISLLCDDFNDDISFGETWMAEVFTLSDILAGQGQMTPSGGLIANGNRAAAYIEAAWLYEQLEANVNATNAVSINHTIWSLFTATPFMGDADVLALHAAASGATFSLTNSQAGAMFQSLTFFTPIPGTQPNGFGRPQEFIGGNGTQGYRSTGNVPEPASMILLATGFVGLGFARFRKKQ